MAFNSSALTAGIGSMIQGIQSSAQQKLQLAQMERQQRIENENLLHQRAMEDLARQGGIEGLNNTKAVNPIQRRILGTQASLGEGLLPSQIKSAELGLIGQDIQNRTGLFNLNEMLPEQKKGLFNANRISGVQGNIAEATEGADITLKKQVPEGNQFTATTKLRSGFDDPIKTIQSSLAVLNDLKMPLADKTMAYQKYNEARSQLASMPGYLKSADIMPSLFGDTSGLKADYLRRLGGKEGEDLNAVLQRYAPERKAPTIADTLDRFGIVPGIVQGLMSGAAVNPSDDYIDRGTYKVSPTAGPSGEYKTPQLNLQKMATGLLDGLKIQISRSAQASQMPEIQLWKEGFGLTDKDFKNGKPNFENKAVKAAIIGRMTMGFVQNKEMQEALIRTNAGYEDMMKNNLSAYLASITKGTNKAQIDASLKTLQLPLINTYVMAFTKATDTFNSILEEMRKAGIQDPQNATIEALIASVGVAGNAQRVAAVRQLGLERDRVAKIMRDANTLFSDSNSKEDPHVRAAKAINTLFQGGFTAPAGTGTPAPAPAGTAPPAGGATLGVNPGTTIAPAAFPPMNTGP